MKLTIGEIIKVQTKEIMYGIVDSLTPSGKTVRIKTLPRYRQVSVPLKNVMKLRLPISVRERITDMLLLSHSISLAWCELGNSQEDLVRDKIYEAAQRRIAELIEETLKKSPNRKVLIESKLRNIGYVVITNAPQEAILEWCQKRFLKETEDIPFEDMLFSSLKEDFYLEILYDSEVGGTENLEVIGIDETYYIRGKED